MTPGGRLSLASRWSGIPGLWVCQRLQLLGLLVLPEAHRRRRSPNWITAEHSPSRIGPFAPSTVFGPVADEHLVEQGCVEYAHLLLRHGGLPVRTSLVDNRDSYTFHLFQLIAGGQRH